MDARGFAVRAANQGGQALLIGETDPTLAQSLMLWNSTLLAQTELREREQTALPPVFAAACVWGRRDAVKVTLERIGALGGVTCPPSKPPKACCRPYWGRYLFRSLGPLIRANWKALRIVSRRWCVCRKVAEVSWRCVCVPPVPAMWPRANRENCVFSLIRRSESDARPLAVKN